MYALAEKQDWSLIDANNIETYSTFYMLGDSMTDVFFLLFFLNFSLIVFVAEETSYTADTEHISKYEHSGQ